MPPDTRARRGFTLVELLVVLAILGVSAVVVSTVRPAGGTSTTRDAVMTRARRLAVQRAQVLTMHLERAGRWAVIVPAGAGPADTLFAGDLGAASDGAAEAVSITGSMTIDAMGSCHPMGATPQALRFDPLRCRWLRPEEAR